MRAGLQRKDQHKLTNHVSSIRKDHRETAYASRTQILHKLNLDSQALTRARKQFPVQWPKAYLALVGHDLASDPIAVMGRPEASECQPDPGDLADAIGDRLMRPLPFMVRKHADRVIILVTKRCHFYCRFCFRREEPPSAMTELSGQDWEQVFAYLRKETDLREVILSGGDPLTLNNQRLFWIKRQLQDVSHLDCWRIHTRAPVHFSKRVDEALVMGLAGGLPLRWVTHFNHHREITGESRRQAHLLARYQIPFLNQAVLLAGVNATPMAQVRLWRGMTQIGIQPYYLHHPDRVPGNGRFRVSLAQGLSIYREACLRLRDAKPRYVLDLPDGRGKVAVTQLEPFGSGTYRYCHSDGSLSTYRDLPE